MLTCTNTRVSLQPLFELDRTQFITYSAAQLITLTHAQFLAIFVCNLICSLLRRRFQGVVSPILERLIALAVGVLLCFLLLSEVTLAVCDNTSHMLQVIFVVARPIPTGVVLEDFHNLPATRMPLIAALLIHCRETSKPTFDGQRSRLILSLSSNPTTVTAPP